MCVHVCLCVCVCVCVHLCVCVCVCVYNFVLRLHNKFKLSCCCFSKLSFQMKCLPSRLELFQHTDIYD